MSEETDLRLLSEILSEQRVITQFHPICSIVDEQVIALEALSRGVDARGAWLPPAPLFATAAKIGRIQELDSLCRLRAIASFATAMQGDARIALFINVDPARIGSGAYDFDSVASEAMTAGLDPGRLTLEISGNHVENRQDLATFIAEARACGLNVALADLGAEFDGSRPALPPGDAPDFFKSSRHLGLNLDGEESKQAALQSLIDQSQHGGAGIVVEGIETQDAALSAIRLGATLLQGYFFGMPRAVSPQGLEETNAVIAELASANAN